MTTSANIDNKRKEIKENIIKNPKKHELIDTSHSLVETIEPRKEFKAQTYTEALTKSTIQGTCSKLIITNQQKNTETSNNNNDKTNKN